MFAASTNVPGYLPETDPVVFDTAAEAWAYLASELERAWDDAYALTDDSAARLTVDGLALEASTALPLMSGPGVHYGNTVTYPPLMHDLGVAYVVTEISDDEASEFTQD
jgi:hypothetical protein